MIYNNTHLNSHETVPLKGPPINILPTIHTTFRPIKSGEIVPLNYENNSTLNHTYSSVEMTKYMDFFIVLLVIFQCHSCIQIMIHYLHVVQRRSLKYRERIVKPSFATFTTFNSFNQPTLLAGLFLNATLHFRHCFNFLIQTNLIQTFPLNSNHMGMLKC